MRWLAVVVALGSYGCGKQCLEYDPGPGCDLVLECCNESTSECEWETRAGTVFECAGGAGNCRQATEDMMCAVCGEGVREALGCNEAHELPAR